MSVQKWIWRLFGRLSTSKVENSVHVIPKTSTFLSVMGSNQIHVLKEPAWPQRREFDSGLINGREIVHKCQLNRGLVRTPYHNLSSKSNIDIDGVGSMLFVAQIS